VERRRVTLDDPLKTLGETPVAIRLHPEVTARLRVNIVRE
jgi:large subunit ribosomal protein L9